MKTVIYTCGPDRRFNEWVGEHQPMCLDEALWFPEIEHIEHGAIPVHPHELIKLVPGMVGERIVTMSEHIILAFQKLVRVGLIDPDDLYLYCGNTIVEVDEDGDLANWPGPFFNERLSLLR
jgi:hypothetical protein